MYQKKSTLRNIGAPDGAGLQRIHDLILREIQRFPSREEIIHIRFSHTQVSVSQTSPLSSPDNNSKNE